MAVLTLVLIGLWLAVIVGLRAVVESGRGDRAEIRFRDPPGTVQWWAKVVSSIGFAAIVGAAVADLLGMPPISMLDRIPVAVVGVGLVVIGIVLTVVAQFAMGDSWRADVDPEVRPALVTSGPFARVRNPVLTGVVLTLLGFVLMTPNLIALAAWAIAVGGMQIQVRGVEEPYLRRTLGATYTDYAARTGRFLPRLGRLH
ncbi:isoprenylcysteine carboxylmethyltransferase family protein [Nocardia sp. NPDC051832]|uniref:methyltransferase family protein n=1 Tax=Nocardia sp. NPDC051832 TaxID=3155673 RepID=UPI003435CE94